MSRAPDLQGPYGRAWCAPDSVLRNPTKAGLGAWLVDAPNSHPIWPWHLVTMIHLRDCAGLPPAQKRYPGAEYEFGIIAIDPDRAPNPDPDAWEGGYPILHPPDVIEQFHGVDDATARHILGLAIRCIVDGKLSPDSDYRRAWHETIEQTVQHFRDGTHGRPS